MSAEYHRRMENTPTRTENESQFEQLRSDNRDIRREMRDIRREMHNGFTANQRMFYGVLLAIFLILLKDIVGI